MQAKNIRSMSDVELNNKLMELKKELFNLRLSLSHGQLTNPKQISRCKKDIARVETVMRERELRAREEA